jgi:3-polyprenyl-4-hydroxybenzoate decarboxylase
MPSFYLDPPDLQAMARQFASRVCDQVGIHIPDIPRWQGV